MFQIFIWFQIKLDKKRDGDLSSGPWVESDRGKEESFKPEIHSHVSLLA